MAMQDVLVLGAGGMLGRKLVAALAGHSLTLHDIVAPEAPQGARATGSDLSQPGEAARLIAGRPDTIFHLAAVVSGEAEADMDKGYRVNLDGTRLLLEAIRQVGGGYRPRLVFASSLAVFGAPFPDPIGDDFNLTPLSSYGTQKAISELLLADYTRRGFVDGIGIRLPTICVRPGKPNKAASSFFSGIIREPLNGMEAVLPVPDTVRHWFASPRAAIGFLMHAGAMDLSPLGGQRSLTMPGISATVADQIAALGRAAGERAVALIRRAPDPAVMALVQTWPGRFHPARALGLGFKADRDFDEIVRIYQDEELERT